MYCIYGIDVCKNDLYTILTFTEINLSDGMIMSNGYSSNSFFIFIRWKVFTTVEQDTELI